MRPPPAFAELAAATNFSFLRGASHPGELVLQAQHLGLAGIALCDRNSLAGVVRGHSAAKDAGFPYKVGARLAFADGTPDILAWPADRAAYGRLCRLLTHGKRRTVKGECHLELADLLAAGKGMFLGVVPPRRFGRPGRGQVLDFTTTRQTMSAPAEALLAEAETEWVGKPPPAVLRDDPSLAATLAVLADAFPQKIRLMAALAYGPGDRRRLARLREVARHYGTPLLATNDVLYHHPDRRPLQDVLTCIREHVTLAEAGRRLAPNAERHLKPAAEMARLFADCPEALSETLAVFGELGFSLDEISYQYPDEPIVDARDPQEALERLTWEGAEKRYPDGVPEKVRATIEHEFRLIRDRRYSPYFLTVYELVRFARQEKILCQGRGSAANSAVCYCLGITDVDPNVHDLLFERFISNERNEPPDIDVDFEHERREEVMQHIYDKYGRERAGIAATVITYRTRSAVREVGKVFGLSDDTIGALAGSVWGWSNEGVGSREAARIGLDPAERTVAQVLALAKEIIGFPRHLSQHVGGYVITRDRLDEVVPVANAAMEDRTYVEWDKDDLDALGILKVDVLALGMLTCIRKAFDFLERDYGARPILAEVLQTEEPAVYDMLCRADSLGVFQVESRAQMTMLPRLRPREFYDLVIEVAIVRPGPIQGDMVHPYLRRRQGIEPVDYVMPQLEPVLKKTLGVPLFQEQAMKIAIVAAGFTPGEADGLRRAMATFRHSGTIGKFRDMFIGGMIARGSPREFAERCFHQIEGFGEYGFPESHAASFSLLVYASAWLKCHYPDVFCAALLNSQPMGFYAPAQIVRDAREHGVAVRPVDVNFSRWDNELEPEEEGGEADPPPRSAIVADPGLTAPSKGVESLGSSALRFATAEDDNEEGAHVWPAILSSATLPRSGGGGPRETRWRGPAAPWQAVRALEAAARLRPSPAARRIEKPHASMRGEVRSLYAVRLGFRQIKGFSAADADRLEQHRGRGYDSVRDLWLRSGLTRAAVERLADADAFRSLGLDRRAALWSARALGGGSEKQRLPLFDTPAAARSTPSVDAGGRALGIEPEMALPPMPLGEHVVNDYRFLGLSLKAHPVGFLRRHIAAEGAVEARSLAAVPTGRRVTVAGLVLVRQRPGSASGVIFCTLEDETGIANIIVWPKVFERFRPVVLGSRFVLVSGRLQNESGVIHVVAEKLTDRTPLLVTLAAEAGELDALARADEVRRPGNDTREMLARRARGLRHPRNEPSFADDLAAFAKGANEALPKGRNFH